MTATSILELADTVTSTKLGPRWYVAYTCARHEKKVADQLELHKIDYYLPLYSVRHQWNRRYVQVQLPLFPGYVFVKIASAEWLHVLNLPSVVHFVGPKGKPSALADSEIEVLRNSLSVRRAEPHPYLSIGRRVRVRSGPLRGLEGVIVRSQNKSRMIVSIDSIARSVAFELDAIDLSVV